MKSIITTRRKAVSPVIATVILIAVAVALGIAVAFWASGLTSSFSKYEKLGVSVQYSSLSTSVCSSGVSQCWVVNLGGQNTGSSDASITQIQVNGIPIQPSSTDLQGSGSSTTCTAPSLASGGPTAISLPLAVRSGNSFCLAFVLEGSSVQAFASGQTIQVTIITAAGNNYPASIVLQ